MRPPQHNAIASPMPHECKCYVPIWTRFIDFLLEGTKIMAVGQDALDKIVSVKGVLESLDLKLDDVRGFCGWS